MSRSGYSDDYDSEWDLIRWRGAVTSAIRGKRGQAFLKETLEALDALPDPSLIANDFVAEGAFCTLGAVGLKRGLEVKQLDPDDQDGVARAFGLPRALACEIMFMNDEASYYNEGPRARWTRMREWVSNQIKDAE